LLSISDRHAAKFALSHAMRVQDAEVFGIDGGFYRKAPSGLTEVESFALSVLMRCFDGLRVDHGSTFRAAVKAGANVVPACGAQARENPSASAAKSLPTNQCCRREDRESGSRQPVRNP
jgi:hypothetical protein